MREPVDLVGELGNERPADAETLLHNQSRIQRVVVDDAELPVTVSGSISGRSIELSRTAGRTGLDVTGVVVAGGVGVGGVVDVVGNGFISFSVSSITEEECPAPALTPYQATINVRPTSPPRRLRDNARISEAIWRVLGTVFCLRLHGRDLEKRVRLVISYVWRDGATRHSIVKVPRGLARHGRP